MKDSNKIFDIVSIVFLVIAILAISATLFITNNNSEDYPKIYKKNGTVVIEDSVRINFADSVTTNDSSGYTIWSNGVPYNIKHEIQLEKPK